MALIANAHLGRGSLPERSIQSHGFDGKDLAMRGNAAVNIARHLATKPVVIGLYA